MSGPSVESARRGWADPDTRTAGVIVISAVAVLVVIARIFRDVNPG